MEYVLQTNGFGLLRDAAMEEEESADEQRRHHDDDGNECGSNVELSSVVANIVPRPSPAVAFDGR